MNVVVCLGRDFLQPEHVMQNEARALKAAELYFSNVASKVILSGGFFSKKDISEAKFLARIIRKAGVPDKDIILEEKSEDTIENAQNCLEIMNVRKFDSAVVVTSNFHLARVKYIFGKIFDNSKEYKCYIFKIIYFFIHFVE